MAVGDLGDPETDEDHPDRVAHLLTVNATWPASALSAVAAQLRVQGHGRILVLSSVAGYRVRRANFVYGTAKAGLDAFAMGLGEALPRFGRGGARHPSGFRAYEDDGGPAGRPVRRRARSGGGGHPPRTAQGGGGGLVTPLPALGLLRSAAAPAAPVAPPPRLRQAFETVLLPGTITLTD